MIDKKYWKEKLQNLSNEELNEVAELLNDCKVNVNDKEDFTDVIKRFATKYPDVKYFCTGSAGKGAYESEGEWDVRDWRGQWYLQDLWEELVDYNDLTEKEQENELAGGDVEILLPYNSNEEWNKVILNDYVRTDDEFIQAFNNSIHKPDWDLNDANDLYNGVTMYEFIEIETGEKKYLYTCAY